MRLKRFVNISSNAKKKLAVIFIVLFIFLAGILATNFFLVGEIVVMNPDKKNELIGLADLKNKNTLFLNAAELEKEILSKNPKVKLIQIQKIYPNKLVVEVAMDKPLAAVRADLGYLYLSETGKIIAKKKELAQNLPVINYYQKIYFASHQAGQKIEFNEIVTSLDLIKTVGDMGLVTDTVDIAGTYMVAFNLEEKKIIFSLEKELAEEKYQLETIVRQFRIEGKDFTSLDLRFDKPVIKIK